MRLLLIKIAIALVFIGIFCAAAYLQWWRCGEMFPHAQLACFIGGGR